MILNTISSRYAKALLDLCNEQNLMDKVYEDMKEIQHLLIESYELRNFLKTPQIDDHTKSRLIHRIFSPHFQDLTVRFLTLLIKKGRSALVIYIVYQFIELYRKQTGIILAQVKTAVCMTEEMHQQIIEKIQKATGKNQVELIEQVDKSLLGGFVLYYDGKSYDASVKRGLAEVKNVLTEK